MSTAIDRIATGEVEKVVLAREVSVEAPAAHEPGSLFGASAPHFRIGLGRTDGEAGLALLDEYVRHSLCDQRDA